MLMRNQGRDSSSFSWVLLTLVTCILLIPAQVNGQATSDKHHLFTLQQQPRQEEKIRSFMDETVFKQKRQLPVSSSSTRISSTITTTVASVTGSSSMISPTSAPATGSSSVSSASVTGSSISSPNQITGTQTMSATGSSSSSIPSPTSPPMTSMDPPLPPQNPANANSQYHNLIEFLPNNITSLEILDRPRSNTSNVFTIRLKRRPESHVIVYFSSEDLQLSGCMFVFDGGNWEQTQTLRVTPNSLSLGDSFHDSKVIKLSSKVLSTNDASFNDHSFEWIGYRRRAVTRSCLSTPHIHTFDGLSYFYTAPGTYYLVNSGALSVQIVQFGCLGGAMCTAAVSVRFGQSVLVLDSRGLNSSTSIPEWRSNSPINNHLRATLDDNNVWNVYLPDGGSRISILHHVQDYGGSGVQHWLTVSVNLAPGWNGVVGLCNSMNSDGSTLSCGDAKTVPGNRSRLMTNVDDCIKTWSVPDNDNHFNLQAFQVPLDDFPGLQCKMLPDSPQNTTSPFQETPPSYTALNGPSGPRDDNMRTASKQGDVPPRFSAEAKQFCERLLLVPGCSNLVSLKFFLFACERDLVVSGSYEKAESMKQSLLLQCRIHLDYLSNDTFTDGARRAQMAQRVWNPDTCPGDCNGNGRCTKTIGCVCNDGFTGLDCGVNTKRFVAYNPDSKTFTDGSVTYSPNEPPLNLTAGAVSTKVGAMINGAKSIDSSTHLPWVISLTLIWSLAIF